MNQGCQSEAWSCVGLVAARRCCSDILGHALCRQVWKEKDASAGLCLQLGSSHPLLSDETTFVRLDSLHSLHRGCLTGSEVGPFMAFHGREYNLGPTVSQRENNSVCMVSWWMACTT